MLDEFIASIKNGGLSRTNRYSVNIAKPFVMDDYVYRQIMLFCDQTQLPGVNYSTIQNRSFGEFREVPYEKLYGDVNLSFYVDKDLYVKDFFDRWINNIQSNESRTFNYYDQYTTTMSVDVQDLTDKSKYRVTLYECYPKTLSPIQLDYSSKDVMKMSVTLQYKYWNSFLIEEKNLTTRSADIDTEVLDPFDLYTQNWNQYQANIQETSKTTGAAIEEPDDWWWETTDNEDDW